MFLSHPASLIIAFLLGAMVGSFLNVVALRMGTGKSFVRSRSRCFSCRKILRWHELIPLLSFIVQRGRCRGCKARLALRYVLVELLTGLVFMAILWQAESIAQALYYMVMMSILVIITLYDIQHKIIPNTLVFLFAGISFLALFIGPLQAGAPKSFFIFPGWVDLFSGPIIAVPFVLLWWFSKGRLMGLGDPKLMLGIGWFLGLVRGVYAIVIGFWVGALVGLALILIGKIASLLPGRKKFTMKSEIPFAPFLVIGAFLVAVFQIDIISILYYL